MFFVSSRRGSSKRFEAWGLKNFRTVGRVCFSFFFLGGGGGGVQYSLHAMGGTIPFFHR